MRKTPSYVKKAVNNYRQNYDFIQVRFSKDLNIREKLADKGNINDYICGLIFADLENEKELEQAENKVECPF